MNGNPTFDHQASDISEAAIQGMASSFYRYAQELFAKPDTHDRYLRWRREQFLQGNAIGLTPIPDDLPLDMAV